MPVARRPSTTRRPRTGFVVAPFLGIHSFQGTSSRGLDPGFRAGVLAGFMLARLFSLNGELVLDRLNPEGDGSGTQGHLAVSPLVHLAVGRHNEIVIGPKLGAWRGRYSDDRLVVTSTLTGVAYGLNAGAFFAVGDTMSAGALLSYEVQNAGSFCRDDGGGELCDVALEENGISTDLASNQILSLSFGLLF
jgi:hypothetical protein